MATKNIKLGRPKGSVNRPKVNKGGLFNVKMEKHIDNTALTKDSGLDYVNWGAKNDYCNMLLDLYSQSPTHAAAIKFGIQSIIGEGVDYEKSNFDSKDVTPNYYQTWDELLRSVATDFMLFGSYAIQIIMNKDGKSYSYFHMPLEKVRWAKYDEDGQITKYYISNDWTSLGTNPPFTIDAFDMVEDYKVDKGKPYLYVYRPYSPTMTYYTAPHYSSAIRAIQSEIEAINFDLRTTVNNFVPSGMLVLNDVETEEERRSLIDNITSMFTGSKGGNSVMISFRSNIEDKSPEFVPFQANQGNVNLYDSLSDRAVNRILAAHGINSPQLIGLPVGSTGFNSEGALLETAYNVYQKVTGNYNRQCIIKTFNFLLKMNGIDTQIVMKPIVFDTNAVQQSEEGEASDDVNSNTYTDDNVEEQVNQ